MCKAGPPLLFGPFESNWRLAEMSALNFWPFGKWSARVRIEDLLPPGKIRNFVPDQQIGHGNQLKSTLIVDRVRLASKLMGQDAARDLEQEVVRNYELY